MALFFLPPEIWDRIFEFAPKDTLMKARLTSRIQRESSDRSLFETIILKNNKASAEAVRQILASARLKGHVRTLHIIARPTDAMVMQPSIGPIETLVPEIRYALSDVYMSSHLTSFVLDFQGCGPDGCVGPILRDSVMDAFRSDMFCFFLKKFTFSRFRISRSPMRALSIRNLQDRGEVHITASASFNFLLSELKTLELSFLTADYDCSSSDHRPMDILTWSFYTALPHVWLQPASQLTELRLSVDFYWGYHPKVDFRKAIFLSLRKLVLDKFTFSHDWQRVWLLRHSASLTHLILSRCSILHEVIFVGRLDQEGYPTRPHSAHMRDPIRIHTYPICWSDYLNSMSECLTQLRYFSMISEDKTSHTAEEVKTILRRERYLVFKYGKYNAVADYKIYHSALTLARQHRNDEQAMRDLLKKISERDTRGGKELGV